MQTRNSLRKLSYILAFTGLTVFTLWAGFYLTQPFFPNVSNEILPLIPDKITAKLMTPYWADKRFNTVDPDKDKIMLSKGGAKIIDGIKIVYKGINNRSQFLMDVIIMDFDREMPFLHTIDISKAKKGFRLVGKDFQLISARSHRAHLWHHKKRQN